MLYQKDLGLKPVTAAEIFLAGSAIDRWHISEDPAKRYRSFDGETPLSQHSVLAALMIGVESELPADLRYLGQHCLLWHDVVEDTRCKLPDDLHPEVVRLVGDMTFHGGTKEEFEDIWKRDPIVWLFKLYDKYCNLADGTLLGGWMWSRPDPRAYIKRYMGFTLNLLERVEWDILPKIDTSRTIVLHIALNIRALARNLAL